MDFFLCLFRPIILRKVKLIKVTLVKLLLKTIASTLTNTIKLKANYVITRQFYLKPVFQKNSYNLDNILRFLDGFSTRLTIRDYC